MAVPSPKACCTHLSHEDEAGKMMQKGELGSTIPGLEKLYCRSSNKLGRELDVL